MIRTLPIFLIAIVFINEAFAASSNAEQVITYYRIGAFLVPIICAITIFSQIDTKSFSILVLMSLSFHVIWIIATAIILKGNVNIANINKAIELIY